MDEALVPHASRLRIGKSNFHLKLDISFKESTLQLVYDVLRLTPFFKVFLVTADVPEIYMQEFWATVTVHHHSIWFKMDNKKHIVNLEYFREMLHICPRLPGQTFNELLFEEEIMAFLRFLGHNGEIKRITDVNINKLHQPWRSFVAIINKCLSGKSSGYDSLRLSQAQILWGLYHKRKVDFAYLMWEDFVYQVEHKDAKKSNEMYYLRFTKVIIHYFMSKDPSIPKRNKTKASVQKTKSNSDTTVTPPPTAAACTRLSTSAKGKQPAKASKAKSADEGTGTIPGVPDVPTKEFDEEISWKSSDEGDDDNDDEEGSDDQDDDDAQDDDDDQDDENKDDDDKDEGDDDDDQEEGNDDDQDSDKEGEEGHDEENDEDELYRDVNINLEGRVVQIADVHTTQEFKDSHVTLTSVNPDGQQQSSSVSSQFVTSMLNPTSDAGIDSIFETTSQMDVQASTIVAPLPLSALTLTPSTIATISTVPQAPTPSTTALSTLLQNLPNFGSLFGFDQNEEFIKNLDENIQKIIKDQVKEQVKSSNSSKTSYAVAANLSEMELKKILIEKMEGNKSIHRSNEQRNLYKALIEAYESDKIILDTYGDTVTLKRCRKEPESASALKEKATRTTGKSTQGSKSQQTSVSESATVEEPMQTTHEMEEPSHPEFDIGYDKHALWGISCWGRKRQQFYGFAINRESARDFYSKCRIIAVTECKIAEWYNYKHLDWTTIRRDDDKLYKFKEVKERFAFNISLRMFTRSIVIQRRVEDLQLGNKDKQNRLMRIDELHKFSDETLTDVRTALDDRLKGIRMKYLPQTIWRKSDKERAAAMIQAIDKQLKTRKIMRSLERFVGGRLYEGDFRMLQRTI
nr:hypothetical protein [Tanacetum cinerariifolium]